VEDDPYYFLYYGDGPRPTSYFALDRGAPRTDLLSSDGGAAEGVEETGEIERNGRGTEVDTRAGRVLRMDSFSKIVSAGFRLGWVTGPNIFVQAIERHVCRFPTPPFILLNPDLACRAHRLSYSHLPSRKWSF
jgi:tryptophan aminotransferase